MAHDAAAMTAAKFPQDFPQPGFQNVGRLT